MKTFVINPIWPSAKVRTFVEAITAFKEDNGCFSALPIKVCVKQDSCQYYVQSHWFGGLTASGEILF